MLHDWWCVSSTFKKALNKVLTKVSLESPLQSKQPSLFRFMLVHRMTCKNIL